MNTNRKCAYITLEQNGKSLIDHMNYMGMDDSAALRNLSVVDIGNIRKSIDFPRGRESWLGLIKTYVDGLKRNEGVSVLVIDSLDVLETLSRFEDTRMDLYHFFEWLRSLELTTLLTMERPLDKPIGDGYAVEANLVDGIINVGLYPTNEISVQRRIRCIKMRRTNHETNYYVLMWDDHRFEIAKAISGGG